MNCAGGTGWMSARSLSRVARCMRASSRRSHHSSAPGAVKAPRIALPSPSSCSSAACTSFAGEPERRGQRGRRHRAEQVEPAAQDLAQRGVAVGRRSDARRRSAAPASRRGTPRAARAAARRRPTPSRPLATVSRVARRCCASDVDEVRQVDLVGGQEAVHAQRVVQLVGAADLGPRLVAHLRDHLRVEAAEVARGLQVHQRLGRRPPWCAAPRPRRRRGRRRAAR